MNLHSLWKVFALVAGSVVLLFLLCAAGLFSFILLTARVNQSWTAPMAQISETLVQEADGYTFTGEDLLRRQSQWAMLIGQDGNVRWQWQKPDDIPASYTLTQVASFTRWYLDDYPVQSYIRDDGLFVVAGAKDSTWKYTVSASMESLTLAPYWLLGLFFLGLICVLGLACLLLRRWFRQDQQVRDAARSDWINGVSHDIRTPLSMVMGYAGQLEQDPALPPQRRAQAAIIRRQSETIRDLVNDLNLTMRLDCQMQALRTGSLSVAPFLRQTAADFLNSGTVQNPLEIALPSDPLPDLTADEFLLRRALNNLLSNCVRHNPPDCPISLGARQEGAWCVLWVESGSTPSPSIPPGPQRQLEADGGAAHGTGLKLVRQIAAAHGGTAKFSVGDTFLCQLWLPLSE